LNYKEHTIDLMINSRYKIIPHIICWYNYKISEVEISLFSN